jgi:DNA-binding transcriptional LysR family regulator
MRRRYDLQNVPTELLRAFVTVVDLRSYTKAAEALGLTQPAVSTQVRRLQEILGCELFKKGAGAQITPRGEGAIAHARRIVAMNDDMLLTVGKGRKRTRQVGIPNGLSRNLLVALICGLSPERCGETVQLRTGNSEVLARDLQAGYLDLAFIPNPPRPLPNAAAEWSEALYWVKSPEFVLRPDAPVPLVSYPGSMSDQFAVMALRQARVPFMTVFTSSELNLRFAAVIAGLGVMVSASRAMSSQMTVTTEAPLPKLPGILAGIYLRDGLTARQIKPLLAVLSEFVKGIGPAGDAMPLRVAAARS